MNKNVRNYYLLKTMLSLLIAYLGFFSSCIGEQINFKTDLKGTNFQLDLCEVDASSFKLQTFHIIPENPQRGQDITIKIIGLLEDEINSGSEILVNVKYKRINLLRRRLDLCESLKKDDKLNLKCPITAGEKQLEYTFNIPQEVPLGEYVVDLLLRNMNSQTIFCSKINIKFE